MPGRAAARKAAAIIIQRAKDREKSEARWANIPQDRKEKLEAFLDAHRRNPIGLVYK